MTARAPPTRPDRSARQNYSHTASSKSASPPGGEPPHHNSTNGPNAGHTHRGVACGKRREGG